MVNDASGRVVARRENFAINGSRALGMILVPPFNHRAFVRATSLWNEEILHSAGLKVNIRGTRKRARAGRNREDEEGRLSTVGTISHFIVVIEDHN